MNKIMPIFPDVARDSCRRFRTNLNTESILEDHVLLIHTTDVLVFGKQWLWKIGELWRFLVHSGVRRSKEISPQIRFHVASTDMVANTTNPRIMEPIFLE